MKKLKSDRCNLPLQQRQPDNLLPVFQKLSIALYTGNFNKELIVGNPVKND
jgi:hypothetical protein